MQRLTRFRHGLSNIIDSDRREFVREVLNLLNGFFGEKLISVVVFGSVARGDAKPSSDTDILVVAENLPKRISEKMEIMAKILIKLRDTQTYRELRKKGINTWVQFYPLTPEEAKIHRPIYLDMVEDAVILVDKDNFLESVFTSLRKRLDELKAKRVYLKNGTWLWDLKPDIKRGEAVEI
ncbi:MAG: nucleotidyltransferase domain-containing protein [Candidatus Brockarchaeota archaeon]|nr:nucleotidyltransferase domain-containing protein [Candidatus Brockarchaeota archaeon]